MTIREQAREAGRKTAENFSEHYEQGFAMDGADAASDVWEPIIRHVLDHSDCHCGRCYELKRELGV